MLINIIDQALSHISTESTKIMKDYNISFVIPPGITPECQTLDISVNKKFKVNVTLLFGHDRLFFDNLNPKIRLKTARINLIDYISSVREP